MSSARYLLVKYIPDLQRMEPRNIGVILWSPAGITARFLKEKPHRLGDVDGREVPSWIHVSAYKQWLKFWRTEIGKEWIKPYRGGGDLVTSTDPRFLDALMTSGNGNFILADGGFLLDSIDRDGLQDAVDHLYTTLVLTKDEEMVKDVSLVDACEAIIRKTKLKTNQYFKPHHPVKCRIGNTVTLLDFNYYYGNGTPERLYERVPLVTNQRDMYVYNAAYMFERVIQNKIIEPDQGGAIIHATQEQLEEKLVRDAINILRGVTRVFNAADETELIQEFENLPVIKTEHANEEG